ncbi:MAG TPA: helix-turn-helix domain-containing protein [Candidatus Dormibacteraeota bacterium]|jgi:transcriptional regulator GlxA family with amidase domain|nr:helix-turn-helix domain-containing protein [Candidatus Dormibacteraeota bacterium]
MVPTVAVIVFDRISIFEAAIACEVFAHDRSDMGLPNYSTVICSVERELLQATAGFQIRADHGLEAVAGAGTVIVPNWRDIAEEPPPELLKTLRQADRRGARIVSFCSGAFVLAAAGLLDGRRATTHWMYAAEFARRYPQVELDPDVLYVADGNVYTSAGSAAGLDLSLHLVELDFGAEVANMFARRIVIPPRRSGGQAQYVERPMASNPSDDHLSATLAWVGGNLARQLTIADLAEHAHMSQRTFARRFQTLTGLSPWRWLMQQRLGAAQALLETTDLSVEQIAETSGFGSAAVLRLHFGRRLGISPTAYRVHFRRRDVQLAG